MLHRMRLLLGLACLLALLPLVLPPTAPIAHAMPTSTAQGMSNTGTDLIPLPGSCGSGLPSGVGAPACCMFGYVFVDGLAIDGAKLTIGSANGSVEIWTARGPDSPQPYYRVSLSDAPLSAQAGETISIAAEYGGHSRVLSHVVLSGGQQVDMVLPSTQTDDYAFERHIWGQSVTGKFKFASAVATDGSGAVYVADTNNSRVQVFDSNGQFLRQWGTLGSASGQFGRVFGIAVDRLGNVYVADSTNRRIQKFSNTGAWLASWSTRAHGIAVDDNGYIYVADAVFERIQKFTSDGVLLLSWGARGSGIGQFSNPFDVSVDAADNVYVADSDNHRIQKFTSDGTFITSWGGFGTGAGQFRGPGGVSVDDVGNVYVADSDNHRIQKFTSSGAFITAWGGFGSGPGGFQRPNGVEADSGGHVYVVDVGNDRIQKFSSTGAFVLSWGSQGSGNGEMSYPKGVDVDGDGNVFVVDMDNHRIQKFSSTGAFVLSWGSQGSGLGQFSYPRDVSVDRDGYVYVTDQSNHRVQKFRSDGTFVASWGGQGSGLGKFSNPWGVAVSRDGAFVYVVDSGNYRIQMFTATGLYLASWGSQGSANGQFGYPQGLGVDGTGNVYVADSVNRRVQKFTYDGGWLANFTRQGDPPFFPEWIDIDSDGNVYVTEMTGIPIQKFSSTGEMVWRWNLASAGTVPFDLPHGVSVDRSGRLYIADTGHNRIQIFRPTSYDRPIATIVQASPRSVTQGQPVELHGMGADSDPSPDIAAYEWTLDAGPTPFATSANATLPTAGLSPGVHAISLRVRDTEGQYSDSQSVSITISPGATSQTWTFLLYLDGDTNNTAPYLNRDTPLGALYRLEHAAPNPNVHVVALYDGPRFGGGDSFRYLIRPDGQLTQEPLGEVNMGQAQTLIDFIRWGQQQAPAEHYYLALADHANGLDGIAWDYTTTPVDFLTNAEIRQALAVATENGARPIDVMHLDGCLMGLLENAYQLRGLARYLVASENLAWSAFAYELYRAAVGPQTNAAALATAIADRYAQRVGEDGNPYTIAALDLSQVDAVARKTDALAGELLRFALASAANRTTLLTLRSQTQALDSNGDGIIGAQDEYIDLDRWTELIHGGLSDSGVQSAAAALRSALQALIVREHHLTGSYGGVLVNLDQARGLGIYYPPQHSARTYQSYVLGGLTFPQDTRWDEFLAAELAALPFDPTGPQPVPVAPLPLDLRPKIYLSAVLR